MRCQVHRKYLNVSSCRAVTPQFVQISSGDIGGKATPSVEKLLVVRVTNALLFTIVIRMHFVDSFTLRERD